MCSSGAERLAEIGRAIDDFAAEAAAAASGPRAHPDRPELLAGHLAARLARLWVMLAEADPGIARRITGYGD
jgi:hypothetical protein